MKYPEFAVATAWITLRWLLLNAGILLLIVFTTVLKWSAAHLGFGTTAVHWYWYLILWVLGNTGYAVGTSLGALEKRLHRQVIPWKKLTWIYLRGGWLLALIVYGVGWAIYAIRLLPNNAPPETGIPIF